MPVLTSSKLLTPDQQDWPHQRTASTTRWPKTNKKMKNNEEKNKVAQKKDNKKNKVAQAKLKLGKYQEARDNLEQALEKLAMVNRKEVA